MRWKCKVRDYSAKTIEEFIKYIDKYYSKSNEKIKGVWNKIKHVWVGFFHSTKDDINGNAERYIQSLTDRKYETERIIVRTWKAVGNVEEQYSADFKEIGSMCEAYANAAKKVSDIININAFSNPASFGGLLNSCADEYMKLIDTKVEKILKKSVDDLTDEDIEILAYVAMSTTDQELKERIYNAFYKDTTDKHVTYVAGAPEYQALRYYDRDEEKWQKFVVCENVYFASYYNEYLDGKISEEEINTYIRNHMAIQHLNKNGKLLFAGKDDKAVNVDESGNLSITIPKREHINVLDPEAKEWDPNSPFFDQEYNNAIANIPLDERPFDWNMEIENGEDARISIEDKNNKYVEDTIGLDTAEKAYKIISKVLDHYFPGFGEILDAAKKYAYDNVKHTYEGFEDFNDHITESSPSYLTNDQKSGYGWFVEKFDVKCISCGDSYTLMPSPDTYDKINELLERIKAERPGDYELLGIPADEAARGGKTVAEWFFDDSCKHPDRVYLNYQVMGSIK